MRPGRMVFVDEGAVVIVTVYRASRDAGEPPVRTIYVNGSSYTGSPFLRAALHEDHGTPAALAVRDAASRAARDLPSAPA